MELREIGLDLPLDSVGNNVLVETEAGRTVLRRNRRGNSHKLTAHLPDGRQVKLDGVPGQRTVRQAVAAMSSARPLRAFQLPAGKVEARLHPVRTVLAFLPWAIGIVAAGVGAHGRLARHLALRRPGARHHDPDHRAGRRQEVAGRLAVDASATASERTTALERAVAILDDLALYYLPTGAQARRAMLGGAPPQLPGRRS
ncbi:hypothetical protein ACFQ06_06360 [Tessaracoccus lubricantis]